MHRVLLVLRLLVILQIAGDLPFGGSAAARAANGAPANDAPVAAAVAAPLPPWRVPDLAAVPDDAAGALIRRGLDLLTHTTALIGPDAPDPSQRFSGSGLECSNCHIDAGTRRFALPLVGIAGLYPRFSARTGAVQDLADRVNDCMERSMNGRPLPRDGREMAALLAYLDFLGSLQPRGEPLVGRGAPRLPLPTRAASPQRGERVYRDMCAACHRPDGAGVRLSPADRMIERRRYVFPPLWGPESYNDAAGMSRIVTGAWFARANMPNGIRYQYPLLAVDDAYDVMAYVDTRPRPHKPNLDRDYPDPWTKPVGTMFPPWPGHFSAERNRFGPWQAILDWRDRHRPRLDGTQSPSLSPQPATVLGHGLD